MKHKSIYLQIYPDRFRPMDFKAIKESLNEKYLGFNFILITIFIFNPFITLPKVYEGLPMHLRLPQGYVIYLSFFWLPQASQG